MDKPEVYLRIKIDDRAVANEKGYLFAFVNENKNSESEPDYKAKGVAIWINEKKPKEEQEQQQGQQTFKPVTEQPREAYRPRVFGARTL